MTDRDSVHKLILEVADEMGIDRAVAKEIFRTFWVNIEQRIAKIPFDEINSKSEFKKYQTSFVIPYLGTYYTTWAKVLRIKRRNKKKWEKQQLKKIQ